MNGQRPNALVKSLERRLVRAWEAKPGPKFGTPTLRAIPPAGTTTHRTFTTTPHDPGAA